MVRISGHVSFRTKKESLKGVCWWHDVVHEAHDW